MNTQDMLRQTWKKPILEMLTRIFSDDGSLIGRNDAEKDLTKNHLFVRLHHLMGPGERLTQTSRVLRHEQTVVSPAVRSKEQTQISIITTGSIFETLLSLTYNPFTQIAIMKVPSRNQGQRVCSHIRS